MAQPHIQPGQVVSVSPLGSQLTHGKTTALFKGQQLEVVRMVLAAGKSLREHSAPGEPHSLPALEDFSALVTICLAPLSP